MKAEENRYLKRSVEVTVGWFSTLFFVLCQLALFAPIEVSTSFGVPDEASEVSARAEHTATSSDSSNSGGDAASGDRAVEAVPAPLSDEAASRSVDRSSASSIPLLSYAPKLPPPFRSGSS